MYLKKDIMLKTEEIKFKVTQEEKDLILANAKKAGMKASQYARFLCLCEHEVDILTTTNVIVKKK